MNKKLAAAVFAWACGALPFSAFAVTSEGTRFLVGFGEHLSPPVLSLIIKGTAGTTGSIEIPGTGTSPFTLPAAGVATIPIPATAQVTGSDVTATSGILVTTSAPVSVYATSQFDPSLDGALVLPDTALGTEYRVLTFGQSPSPDPSTPLRSEFLIVSGADGTTVNITPTTSTVTHPAGLEYTITLQRLQAYQLQSETDGQDLSGALITSSAPVAVFAGGTCLPVPLSSGGLCSHLVEQMPPTSAWDSRYFTVPLSTSSGGYLVRVLGSVDSTQLTWSAVPAGANMPPSVSAGQVVEVVLPADQYFGLVATQPVLVMEYSQNFDALTPSPFMTLVPGVQRYLARQSFATPALAGLVNTVGAILQDDVSLCALDGASLAGTAATPIGASGFVGVRIPVTAGAHTLACPQPLGAIVYGAGPDIPSYGYPAGYFFSSAGAPIADAGPDVTALEGTLVTLDGSASRSPTGQALTYTWSQVSPVSPRVVLDTTNPARPTFTAPQVSATSTFTFSLVVSSPSDGASVPDLVSVTVVDSSIVPPPVGCSSSVLTVADLESEVATIASSGVTITVLEQTLTRVQSAADSKNLKVARYGMVLFIGEVVNRSNPDFAPAHRLSQDDANRLLCSAANVLTKIQP